MHARRTWRRVLMSTNQISEERVELRYHPNKKLSCRGRNIPSLSLNEEGCIQFFRCDKIGGKVKGGHSDGRPRYGA